MKVLHIINSLLFGGAEKMLIDSIKHYEYLGVDVNVLCLKKSNSELEINALKCFPNKFKILNVDSLYDLSIANKLRKEIIDFDIVHAHLFPTLYWVSLLNVFKRKGSFFFFTEHSTENRRRNKFILRFIDRKIYSSYDKIICISRETKDNLSLHLNNNSVKKLITINNGADITSFVNAVGHERAKFNFDKKDKILIQVASFRAAKDQMTVIKSLSQLPNRFKLIFVGDGPLLESCKKLAHTLKLEDRIQFLGIRSDVASLFKMSDIAISSSNYEGFGLAAVEAMATGKPIIATNVPGLKSVVEGSGLLFEVGDVKGLIDNILNIESNPQFYRELVKSSLLRSKKFEISLMVNRYFQEYKNMLND